MKPVQKFEISENIQDELEYLLSIVPIYNPFEGTDETYIYNIFRNRYNNDEILKNTSLSFEKYINNNDIKNTLKGLGIDQMKFWYLLLFVFDFSYGYCTDGKSFENSGRSQLEEFAKAISDNLKTSNTFKKPCTITLNISGGGKGKSVYKIDRSLAIVYLMHLCQEGLDNLPNSNFAPLKMEDNPQIYFGYALNICPQISKTKSLANYKLLCYFSEIFEYFFKVNNQFNKQKEKGIKANFNKKELISRLIYLTGIDKSKKLIDGDGILKGYQSRYKKLKTDKNRINEVYAPAKIYCRIPSDEF